MTTTLSSERIARIPHPAWCDDHAWDQDEDGWHECKPLKVGSWSLYLTTGGMVASDRPVISLEDGPGDKYMTPTYARLLAQALVMAADAVEKDQPL